MHAVGDLQNNLDRLRSELRKARYEANPLDDGTLAPFRVLPLDISKMTLAAVGELGLSQKEALRCKNLWTLGLVFWMYGRRRAEIAS